MLLQVLALSLCHDRLDGSNLAGLELAARRVIMIERAVKVNPKAPSFVGLHRMVQHSLDEGGVVATREFTDHIAKLAESEARILKQSRLLREELEAKSKNDRSGKHGKPGGAQADGQ
eukprot:11213175-Lingulodinium_polyedra.AAC.1